MATDSSIGSVWSTCLREIAFRSADQSQDAGVEVKGVEILHEADALNFLIEVLCGLHSPVLGETEIMSQFKAFLATCPDDHELKRDSALLPFLMTTVKEIRRESLVATGSLGYGQVVRRWLKPHETAVLWGYGSLGQELFPWMKEKTKEVRIRRPRAVEGEIPFVIGDAPARAQVHVIAAPLDDATVEALLAESELVIDLRDRPLASRPGVRNLKELFAHIRDLQNEREDVLPRCLEQIRLRVQEHQARHQIRPFGWEDLCG